MNDTTRTITIKGVKLDVDLREATTIHSYKVGDPVKILVKQYGDSFKVYPGVIIGFEPFEQLPTVVVAYLEHSYSEAKIVFCYINDGSKEGIELCPAEGIESLGLEKGRVLELMNNEIRKKEREIIDCEKKKEYFLRQFGQYFSEESRALN